MSHEPPASVAREAFARAILKLEDGSPASDRSGREEWLVRVLEQAGLAALAVVEGESSEVVLDRFVAVGAEAIRAIARFHRRADPAPLQAVIEDALVSVDEATDQTEFEPSEGVVRITAALGVAAGGAVSGRGGSHDFNVGLFAVATTCAALINAQRDGEGIS